MTKQKKFKLKEKEEEESHIPPLTDKPLRIDEVKEEESKVDENVHLTDTKRSKRLCC